MATKNSAELLGYGEMVGRLAPGCKADLVLLNYDAMCGAYCNPAHDSIETLIYRGRKDHVHTVMVNGRVGVQGGQVCAVDMQQVGARLRSAAAKPLTLAEKGLVVFWEGLKNEVVKFYQPWPDELSSDPYFVVNSRT